MVPRTDDKVPNAWRLVVAALRVEFWIHDRNPDADLDVDWEHRLVRGRLPGASGRAWHVGAFDDASGMAPRETAKRWFAAYVAACEAARVSSPVRRGPRRADRD
jgi:hypothetical protein